MKSSLVTYCQPCVNLKDESGYGLSPVNILNHDSAPAPIKEGIPKDEAEALQKQLEEAGAEVELK